MPVLLTAGILLPAAPAGSDQATGRTAIAEARMEIRHGRESAALRLLAPLFGDPVVGGEAGGAALWAMRQAGQWNELRALAASVPPDADPRLVGRAAESLADLGDDAMAESLLEQALAIHKEASPPYQVPLHVARGYIAEGRGERARARAAYALAPAGAPDSLPDTFSSPLGAARVLAPADSAAPGPKLDLDAAQRADAIVLAGRAARGRGEFQEAKNLFERAREIDPGHEEAPLVLAALLLEKHETQLARTALRSTLGANPRNADAGLLLARTHLADGRYREVEATSQKVLAIDAHHPGALELLAMLDLADGDLDAAEERISAALAVVPERRSMLALRAGLRVQSGERARGEREIETILAAAPSYADAYYIVGGCLDRLRRYREAAEFYERALVIDPEHAAAANALGLSAMRDGREEDAARWLDRGFALDSFNIRTYNMRLLLKKLETYHRFETPHFILKLDEQDLALAPLLGSYMEEVHADLCARFGFQPERKTTIEIFSEPDLLSARLIGLPGIEGIPGACFGPVIAMDSPRLWNGKINWRTVARHEFGHVLALTETEKQVPFWFTEGLSVVLEGYPPSIAGDRVARWALLEDELIPFTELNHGFTRPKTPLHRTLAYYQSSFAVRRLIDRYGFDAVLGLLDEYAAGSTNAEAIANRFHITEAEWAADVDQAIRAHVMTLPVWALGSGERLTERVHEAEARPGDLDARTRMAEEWFQSGELETAVSEALAVLEADSTQTEARLLLGHALMLEGDFAGAAQHLGRLLDRHPVNYLVVRDLGIIYAELGEDEAAIAYLTEAIRAYPVDPEPYRKLAAVHERAGEFKKAVHVLAELAAVEEAPSDDLAALAALCREQGLRDEEAAALEQNLAVRPFDRDTVSRLANLYRETGDAALAVRTYEVLCLLDPDSVEAHTVLVELALAHGPQETARRYAGRLQELDPANDLARRVLTQ